MLCADGVGWGQFLHGSADGGLGREKKDAVNGYELLIHGNVLWGEVIRWEEKYG